MLRRTSALVATIAALTCVALPAQAHRAAPTVATPVAYRGPDPSALPKGQPPAVTWQSGTTIHTARGRTIQLPLGKGAHGYQVLGKRGGEWLVAKPGYHAAVLAVRGSHVRTVWTHVYDESSTQYLLSQGADLVLEWNLDRSGFTKAVLFDLHGNVVAEREWNTTIYPLDIVGGTILMSGRKTSVWKPPAKPVRVAPGATYGNLGSGLLFVDLPHVSVGPTSLATPGTPPWSATEWSPRSVSDDGAYVAGLDFARRVKLAVRRVSDGTLVPVPAFRADFDTPIAWEPDGSLLVPVRSAQGRTIVRCTMTGVCERTTPYVRNQALGFPG